MTHYGDFRTQHMMTNSIQYELGSLCGYWTETAYQEKSQEELDESQDYLYGFQ